MFLFFTYGMFDLWWAYEALTWVFEVVPEYVEPSFG